MKLFFTIIFFSFCFTKVFSQATCANPINVTLCPSTTLLNQTNAGMGDEPRVNCNAVGEDLVYSFSTAPGATKVIISVLNANNPLALILYSDSCDATQCLSHFIQTGNSIVSFNIQGSANYNVVVESAFQLTFDISFGGDTATTFVNIPNTMGSLGFSANCASPVFLAAKPFFQVNYNGVFKTDPMTLSPLNIAGTMCISAFFQNTTGVEAIKRFEINFNPLGYSSVQSVSTIPGFYLPGNWVIYQSGHRFICEFIDLLGNGHGDFSGTPNTCLEYEFCFDVIPISNDPDLTNVKVDAWSDGNGAGFIGPVVTGCCPSMNAQCFGPSSSNGTSGGSGFSFTFTDPGNPLPVELIDFSAKPDKKSVRLQWTTAAEINNDYFTLEKSADNLSWMVFEKIRGSGNSTVLKRYETADINPYSPETYYRLSQTDYDGTTEILKTVTVKTKNRNVDIAILNEILLIDNFGSDEIEIYIYNSIGKKISHEKVQPGKTSKSISEFARGIYFISLYNEEILTTMKFMRK